MILKNIDISNFRNLKSVRLEAGSAFNLLVGKNAQGKSSFLEALFSLSIGRSYRTRREEEVIGFGGDFTRAAGEFSDIGGDFFADAAWERSDGEVKKTIRYNNKPLSRLSDFIDKVPMVLLVGDDLDIIRGEPQGRRKFFDLLCSRLNPAYLADLRDYKKVLDLRNRWLKLPGVQRNSQLGEVYREKLCSSGARIIYNRAEAVKKISDTIGGLYREVFSGEPPNLLYLSSPGGIFGKSPEEIEDILLKSLARAEGAEFQRGYTLTGPHRDDFQLNRGDLPMKTFSSMGEIRTAAVILKIAEADVISRFTGREPVFLVDDSLNEFDPVRIKFFLRYITASRRQIFFVATRVADYLDEISDLTPFLVSEGRVEKCTLSRLRAF